MVYWVKKYNTALSNVWGYAIATQTSDLNH
jgi:hypothetical protein